MAGVYNPHHEANPSSIINLICATDDFGRIAQQPGSTKIRRAFESSTTIVLQRAKRPSMFPERLVFVPQGHKDDDFIY